MLQSFIDGFLTMSFAVAGLLFLRFWRRTRDRLFLLFALAFWILAINRVLQAWLHLTTAPYSEHATPLFVVRLVAFSLMLLAIIDKNRSLKHHRSDHNDR